MQIGNFEGEGTTHCKVQGLPAASSAKTAESMEVPFEYKLGWVQGSM